MKKSYTRPLALAFILAALSLYGVYQIKSNALPSEAQEVNTHEAAPDATPPVAMVEPATQNVPPPPPANSFLVKLIPGLSDEVLTKKINGKTYTIHRSPQSQGKPSGHEKLGIYLITVLDGDASQDAIADMFQFQKINGSKLQSVFLNKYLRVAYTPNDPSLVSQWHHKQINSVPSWDFAKGNNTTIAVVDTGLDPNHQEFTGKTLPGWNFLTGTTDTKDDNSHGTFTAGLAGALGDNGLDVVGQAYQSKIMPLKVCSNTGWCEESDVLNAIVYAVDHGAKVISVSIGPVQESPTYPLFLAAGDYARQKGASLVFATGNNYKQYNEQSPIPVMESPNILFVGSTGANDTISNYSNYGTMVDAVAPGESILSTNMGGGTKKASGTSGSTPIIAGVLADLYSLYPFTPQQAEHYIFETAKDLGAAGWDPVYGWGRIDAGAALAMAKAKMGDTTPPAAPTAISTSSITQTSANVSWTTAEVTDSVVEYGPTTSYGFIVGRMDSVKGHTVRMNNLLSNTTYHYRIRSSDAAGNVTYSPDLTFKTAIDTVAANLTSIYALGNAVLAKVAVVSWNTNKLANSQVDYGTTTAYGNTTTLDPTYTLKHSVMLSGLQPDTLYHFRVRSTTSSNITSVSGDYTFKTALDTQPLVYWVRLNGTPMNGTINWAWNTNDKADTQVEYGLTTSYGSKTPLVATMTTVHGASIKGLTPGKTYHFRMLSRDAGGNLGYSADMTAVAR